jgi:hypothetical protein
MGGDGFSHDRRIDHASFGHLTFGRGTARLKNVRIGLPAAAVLIALVALALTFGLELGFFDGH